MILALDQTVLFPSTSDLYSALGSLQKLLIGGKKDRNKSLSSLPFQIWLQDEKPGDKGFLLK
jgi:hypothetical protein